MPPDGKATTLFKKNQVPSSGWRSHGLSSGKEFNIPQYYSLYQRSSTKFKPTYLIGHSLSQNLFILSVSLPKWTNNQNGDFRALSDFKIILNNYIKC
jgi:hypothetical protein